KRVEVCHPPGKMWPELATRSSASLRRGDRPVQPEGWITHEPVALFGLLWNTHVEVHMPSCDRERDAGVQLLLGRTIMRHVHNTNKLVSGSRSINFRVEQAGRLVRVKALLVLQNRGLPDEVVDVLVLLRHKDRVAVGLSLAIVTVPLC